MKVLRGAGGVELAAMKAKSDELEVLVKTEKTRAKELERASLEAPRSAYQASGPSGGAAVLKAEAGKADSRIDWSRLPRVQAATKEALDAAWEKVKLVEELDYVFYDLLRSTAGLSSGVDPERLGSDEARIAYQRRTSLIGMIEQVRDALAAAGPCAATAHFPVAALDALEKNLRDDSALLFGVHGPGVKEEKPGFLRSLKGGWGGYFKKEVDPKPDMLPKSVALEPAQVASLDGAVNALVARLGAPNLGPVLQAAAAKAGPARAELERHLGAFALLADEAVSAPDYDRRPRSSGPEHRQAYRARQHAGNGDVDRQKASRRLLADALHLAARSDDPVRALGEALVREFLREVGVPAAASWNWKAAPEHVRFSLEREAFLPLRAYNERAPVWTNKGLEPAEVRRAVQALTQSVVEGRYEAWRLENAGSRAQLAILSPAQREAWLAPLETKRAIQDKEGKPVELRTFEPQAADLSLFWATKIGGPSHGFDTMTNCALSLATNARNTTVVVEDPRWPNGAGRAYMRLMTHAESKRPVLFLESASLDFPYPGPRKEIERAVLDHGIAKAKQLGVQLVVSGSAMPVLDAAETPGKWRRERYELAPALLLEAASVFGFHDWAQQKPEVLPMVKQQFWVDMAAV